MLICDDTDEKNLPKTNGSIIVNQYLTGSLVALGTFHNHKNGIRYIEIDNSWTIESVIG